MALSDVTKWLLPASSVSAPRMGGAEERVGRFSTLSPISDFMF